MLVEEILDRESQNGNLMYLYPQGSFYSAYQLSAYLLQTHFWPEIKLLYKKIKNRGEYVRVGFRTTSVPERVLEPARKQAIPTRTESVAGEAEPLVIVGPFEVNADAYQRWREEFFSDYNRARLAMTPFYGNLPLYKKTYDLVQLIIGTTRNFPRELQTSLGSRLVDLIVESNSAFYKICKTNNTRVKLDQLERTAQNFDTMKFLLRVAFDQHAYGMDRNVRLMEIFADIDRQMYLYKNSIQRKEQRDDESE